MHINDDNDTPTDGKVYYIRVKKFVEVLKNTHILIRINYPENTSYLFENSQGQLNAISFSKDTENINDF